MHIFLICRVFIESSTLHSSRLYNKPLNVKYETLDGDEAILLKTLLFLWSWYYKPMHYNTPKVEREAIIENPASGMDEAVLCIPIFLSKNNISCSFFSYLFVF